MKTVGPSFFGLALLFAGASPGCSATEATAATAPDASSLAPEDAGNSSPAPSVPCDSPKGLLRKQTIDVDGTERVYLLNVPASYDCARPAALVVDFHALGGGDEPEAMYILDAAVALSEKEGFILLRPRGLARALGSSQEGAFAWDVPAQHTAFVDALLARIEGAYAVDPARRYAFGFSSGTYMATDILLNDDPRFRGVGVVGGAFRGTKAPPVPATTSKRIYASAGYRDPNARPYLPMLVSEAPPAQLFVRETPAGHVLRPFQYEEAIAYLDKGTRPAAGAPAAGWSARPSLGLSTTGVARVGTKTIAFGTTGFGSDPAGGSSELSLGGTAVSTVRALPWVGYSACALDAGPLFVVDGGEVRVSLDGAATFGPGPALASGALPLQVLCSGSTVTIFAYTQVLESVDGGVSFHDAVPPSTLNPNGFTFAAATTSTGTQMTGGSYGYLGRRLAGASKLSTITSLQAIGDTDFPPDVNALAAAGSVVWAAGSDGLLARSDDDGKTFKRFMLPTTDDLYVLSFSDAEHGVVGGSRGTVFTTIDGGTTWLPRPTGGDGYVGAVVWTTPSHVVILGAQGTALERDL